MADPGTDPAAVASDAPVSPAPPVAPPPLPLDIEEHLTWLAAEKGRSANTLAAYRRDLTAYWAWLSARGMGLDDVRGTDIDAYVGALRERGLAPASVKRALVAIRSLHRFRAEEGLATADPGAEVETPRVPSGLPKALTEAEVGLLLDQVVGDEPVARRDRALLELLYGTGARISEVCAPVARRHRPRRQPRAPVRQGGQGAGGAARPLRSNRPRRRGSTMPAAAPWPQSSGPGGATPRPCS